MDRQEAYGANGENATESVRAFFRRFNALCESGRLRELTVMEHCCLWQLIKHADNLTGNTHVTPRTIAQQLGNANVNRVRGALEGLEQKGFVQTIAAGRPGRGYSTVRQILTLPPHSEKGPASGPIKKVPDLGCTRIPQDLKGPVDDQKRGRSREEKGAGERSEKGPASGPPSALTSALTSTPIYNSAAGAAGGGTCLREKRKRDREEKDKSRLEFLTRLAEQRRQEDTARAEGIQAFKDLHGPESWDAVVQDYGRLWPESFRSLKSKPELLYAAVYDAVKCGQLQVTTGATA